MAGARGSGAITGLVAGPRTIVRGRIAWRDGRIAAAADTSAARALPDGWIVAHGFVDLQVNGMAGAEVGADADECAAVARALPATGVTAFCPTLVTRGARAYARAARTLAAGPWPADGARSLGVHLEGPFLAPARAGAHPRARLVSPDPGRVEALAAAFRPRVVTLAPELPGALEAVARLARDGTLVACGHTEASFTIVRAAIAAGARMLTHALNAMPPILAREPGPAAAFLADRRARIGLIADGVHVDPAVAALLARLAGPRLVLVSDAVAATLAPPGRHRLGEREIRSDGRRVTTAGGRLAGGSAGIDAGVRTLVAAGVDPVRAIAAASAAPRRLLGLPAALRPGVPVDLVVLDARLVPRATLVAGRLAWADAAGRAALGVA